MCITRSISLPVLLFPAASLLYFEMGVLRRPIKFDSWMAPRWSTSETSKTERRECVSRKIMIVGF